MVQFCMSFEADASFCFSILFYFIFLPLLFLTRIKGSVYYSSIQILVADAHIIFDRQLNSISRLPWVIAGTLLLEMAPKDPLITFSGLRETFTILLGRRDLIQVTCSCMLLLIQE